MAVGGLAGRAPFTIVGALAGCCATLTLASLADVTGSTTSLLTTFPAFGITTADLIDDVVDDTDEATEEQFVGATLVVGCCLHLACSFFFLDNSCLSLSRISGYFLLTGVMTCPPLVTL